MFADTSCVRLAAAPGRCGRSPASRALLLHRRGDRRRDLVDLADRPADARRWPPPPRSVAAWIAAICAAISSVALAVWLASLFTSRGHDREALAGIAGARRLDRRVQRQQVGLAGDVVDQRRRRRRSSAPPRRGP